MRDNREWESLLAEASLPLCHEERRASYYGEQWVVEPKQDYLVDLNREQKSLCHANLHRYESEWR